MEISDFRHCALSWAAAGILVGCGASPPAAAPGAMPQNPQGMAQPAAGQYVYVVDQGGVLNNGAVSVYDPGLTKRDRLIFRGSSDAYALAFGSKGTLYVLNVFYAVTEYDRGKIWPSRRAEHLPGGIAFGLDPSDNLYVANCYTCIPYAGRRPSGQRDQIDVYRAGETKLWRTITRGIDTPISVAFDSAGYLYVLNRHGHNPSITVYAPGSGSVLRTIRQGLHYPRLMVVDRKGDVFASTGNLKILEYGPGSSKVVRTITDDIHNPQGLALSSSGALYVANAGAFEARGWISVYDPGSSTAAYEIVDGIHNPVALALDRNDTLYVANDNWGVPWTRGRITVYPQKP